MYKGKGLSLDSIVDTATRLTAEKGYGNFSTRDIALRLGVRAASLYHYTDSIDDVNQRIGEQAAIELNTALNEAIQGKEKRAALEALAYAYRDFATQQPEIYRAIMGLPHLSETEELRQVGKESFRPIRTVVEQYGLPRQMSIHFARCFRGALHGFVTLQENGYYTNRNVSAEDSFRFLIDGYASWLTALSEEQDTLTKIQDKE